MLIKIRDPNEGGFTLIELMIVVAIIAILAAIAIPNFLAYRTKGQDAAAEYLAKDFFHSALAYFSDLTTSGTSLDTNGAPAFQHDSNIIISGGRMLDVGGDIDYESPLTFSHYKSTKTYTIDRDGNLSGS